jgi:hypothetical protein
MTKSVVCEDISLDHKVKHSEHSISRMNHQQEGLIFNGRDPISSSDQRLSGSHNFKAT